MTNLTYYISNLIRPNEVKKLEWRFGCTGPIRFGPIEFPSFHWFWRGGQLIHLQRSGMVQEIEIPNSNAESLGTTKLAQLKLRSAMKQGKTEGRRSFSHAKEKPRRDDHNAHSFPAYMATTESTKAKVRSSITPKQRRLRLSESSYSCQESSPSKLSISSFNTELIFNP